MTQNNVEALLEQAALSSELSGWNDQLQWLVNATLSRFEKRRLLQWLQQPFPNHAEIRRSVWICQKCKLYRNIFKS